MVRWWLNDVNRFNPVKNSTSFPFNCLKYEENVFRKLKMSIQKKKVVIFINEILLLIWKDNSPKYFNGSPWSWWL